MLFFRSSSLPEGFPLRTFRVGALLMSGMVAALVLLNLWVEHNIRQTVRDGAALSAAVDELKDYGQTLVLPSARSYLRETSGRSRNTIRRFRY